VTRRRGRRRKKLLDDLEVRRGYSHLKEEALVRTMWRNCFRVGFGPVVRQNTEWMMNWKTQEKLRKMWRTLKETLPVCSSKNVVINLLNSLRLVIFIRDRIFGVWRDWYGRSCRLF